ncbi:MAG: hypothetical protein IJJ76_13735 [Ruminococcus sp.]|uniref:hypothetical protein n=1 Tax=Ruminococcus sp. TaxID=41978 RepID=UPI0025E9B2B9|nr:hypothetical protein [Ruminococcus sp.]MBR0530811.1 hypothetical protein [Ruminococcus sp.]
MVCKTCGKPVETGEKMCRNCGTLTEFGLETQKVELKKHDPKNDFRERAAQFGEVTVRERKASALASLDPKTAVIILLCALLVIFFSVVFYYEKKTVRAEMNGYDITLPFSMREVKDKSFEIMNSTSCKSYANNKMEFTCIQYDAETLIPDLAMNPSNDDIEGLNAYYSAKSKLEMLDIDFAKQLDRTFSENLKKYKRSKLQNGVLEFTYNDNAMVDNYVAVHVVVKDNTVYQFSLLCSSDQKSKLDKQFKDIFKSIEMH